MVHAHETPLGCPPSQGGRAPGPCVAGAGDIVTVAGVECAVGDTLTTLRGGVARPLVTPPLAPPTLSMTIGANTSPFAGSCGSARVKDRLLFETDNNVTIDVKTMGERCEVFARGERQLGILIEQMRREGYEVLVSRPEVLRRQDEKGKWLEPIERGFLEVPQESVGDVMEALAARKGNVTDMAPEGDRMTLEALAPTRGLIGFEVELLNLTRGEGLMSHLFHEYAPDTGEIPARRTGVLVSKENGAVTAYALDQLQERGRLMVEPGDKVLFPNGNHVRRPFETPLGNHARPAQELSDRVKRNQRDPRTASSADPDRGT